MTQASFTAGEILAQLDELARQFRFPVLDNGYVYPADVRLSAYADRQRWAILIETLGYSYKLGLPGGIGTWIYNFGNCLTRGPGHGEHIVVLDYEGGEEYDSHLPASVREVRIRGQSVAVPRDRGVYAAKGIKLRNVKNLQGEELLRVLLPEHRELLLATEEERGRHLRANLPLLVRLNEWHHPDLTSDELPSSTATFQRLAEVLVTGDPNRLVMDLPPNTHWRNWPMGGAL
jgi:hypothetical protein